MLGCGCTALNVSYNPNDEEHAMFYCDDINSPEKWDWWLKVWPQLSPPFNIGNLNKPNKQGYFKIHTTISVQFQSCSNPNPEVATFHNGKSNCSGTLGRKIDTYDRCYFFCDRVNMKIHIKQALVCSCSEYFVYYNDAVQKELNCRCWSRRQSARRACGQADQTWGTGATRRNQRSSVSCIIQ